jgi:hypothetical protein
MTGISVQQKTKPVHVEWDCEGCGCHIIAFGIARIPSHQLCGSCLWFCEYLNPEDIAEVRRFLQPGHKT